METETYYRIQRLNSDGHWKFQKFDEMYAEDEARSFLAMLQTEEPNELRRIAKITTTLEILNN